VQSFILWQQATIVITCHDHSIIACSHHINVVLFFAHIPFMVNHMFNTTPTEWLQQHPLLLQRTAPIACSFYKSFTQHDLHILVTAPFCCDRKDQMACAQSFTLWQQATIEITCHDHSIFACLRHIYVVLFFAHIPFMVNHTFNATPTEWLQQLLWLCFRGKHLHIRAH